jgi:hypothetical protein
MSRAESAFKARIRSTSKNGWMLVRAVDASRSVVEKTIFSALRQMWA